jgi:hypothetical protein
VHTTVSRKDDSGRLEAEQRSTRLDGGSGHRHDDAGTPAVRPAAPTEDSQSSGRRSGSGSGSGGVRAHTGSAHRGGGRGGSNDGGRGDHGGRQDGGGH